MTQKDKDLLLKDLCARSPYGVKFRHKYIDNFFHESYTSSTLIGVLPPYRIIHSTLTGNEYLRIEEDEVKPYLFPLSSMTEEQNKEFDQLIELELEAINGEIDHVQATVIEVDFYNKYHLDWRGLIPLGLAIDATGKNIY